MGPLCLSSQLFWLPAPHTPADPNFTHNKCEGHSSVFSTQHSIKKRIRESILSWGLFVPPLKALCKQWWMKAVMKYWLMTVFSHDIEEILTRLNRLYDTKTVTLSPYNIIAKKSWLEILKIKSFNELSYFFVDNFWGDKIVSMRLPDICGSRL